MTKLETELTLENLILRKELINLNGILLGKDLKEINERIIDCENELKRLNEVSEDS